jgi:hypothetical protein
MRTIEIPKATWVSFLTDLTRNALDRPVRLEVENIEIGDQEMGDKLPLREIELEMKGSNAGGLEITVGGRTDELSHRIERPTRLYAQINDSQQIECLSIEDADNGKTLLFFEELPSLSSDRGAQQEQASAP